MSSTEQHDELPVPHFEDRLWQVLSDAHVDRRRHGAGFPRHGRSRLRPGRRLLAAGAASIAAAATVIAAVSIVGSDGGGGTPGDPGDRATAADGASRGAVEADAEVDLAARITAATRLAITDSVVHTVQDQATGPGDSEGWSDETSGAWRSLGLSEDGTPSYDHGTAEAPAVDAVAPPSIPEPPEECNWTAVQSSDPSSEANPPEAVELPDCPPAIPHDHPTVMTRTVDYCFGEYVEVGMPALPARNEAEFVGEQLAAGELVEDGTEVIDGQELIRLRTPGEWAEHTYYVDSDTYRPVQLHGYPDEAGVPLYVMTFEYLPRTPENLALLVAPIPDGFTHADDLHSDGERLAAGCGF